MTYEIVPGMSGFGAFGGAGDLLGESCLCGPSGACTNAKLQGPALAQLRAAMAAAGLSPSTGVWKQSETNQMNALAAANGQPASSKFLVDGGPCRALKAKLAAPAPTGGGTTTAGGVTCASLLSQAPPIPPGTPVDAVIAVLQQLAPPGFDVRACVANSTPAGPATTIPQPGRDILPPGTAGGSTTVTTGDTSGLSPLLILGLGLVAVMGVGGIAFVALSPKMRKNGRRSRKRMRRNGRPGSLRWQKDAHGDTSQELVARFKGRRVVFGEVIPVAGGWRAYGRQTLRSPEHAWLTPAGKAFPLSVAKAHVMRNAKYVLEQGI